MGSFRLSCATPPTVTRKNGLQGTRAFFRKTGHFEKVIQWFSYFYYEG